MRAGYSKYESACAIGCQASASIQRLALLHLFRRPLSEVFLDSVLRPIGGGRDFQWEGYDDAWVEINGQRMQSGDPDNEAVVVARWLDGAFGGLRAPSGAGAQQLVADRSTRVINYLHLFFIHTTTVHFDF